MHEPVGVQSDRGPGVQTRITKPAGPEEELESKARLTTLWLHRGAAPAGTTDQLDRALRGLTLPAGDGYVWIACEALVAKRLRAIMVDERQHPKAWIKAAGFFCNGPSRVNPL
ncbi:siderophore-interacting protein [Rhizobium mongolense]|uniref:siderophore-interacting protein n=1 Tax=Rhizobium TaxID=379 RepID=UPI0024B2058E|nr:SIP domain-containing protein [Rhizobium sp. CC1099]WFU85758.1 SIP domain-containing protein [Rhizobium sp. CC1099]